MNEYYLYSKGINGEKDNRRSKVAVSKLFFLKRWHEILLIWLKSRVFYKFSCFAGKFFLILTSSFFLGIPKGAAPPLAGRIQRNRRFRGRGSNGDSVPLAHYFACKGYVQPQWLENVSDGGSQEKSERKAYRRDCPMDFLGRKRHCLPKRVRIRGLMPPASKIFMAWSPSCSQGSTSPVSGSMISK